ncbi:MAG: DUF456 domain-containing protein [Planctomycetota bacterium]
MLPIFISLLTSLWGIACWIASVLGLPGNWGVVAVAALLAWLAPEEWNARMSWASVLIWAALAGLGELLECVAGSAGVSQSGGSRRAMVLALMGSLCGAIVGFFVGLPIPVIGGLVASLLFSGLGAAAGAILGQRWLGRNWSETMSVGWAAFYGRLLGTLGKSVCGAAMVIVLLYGVWF